MGCLSSIEAPLSALITIIFLVRSLFLITYKVVESNSLVDEEALDAKDMLMPALGIMSLIGICSSRRAFGVFTMLFMLHAFFYSAFHLFHTTAIFIKSFDEPCRFLKAPATGQLTSDVCHAMNGFSLVCTVATMIATALATMAVFLRLTTVIVHLSDMRSMATTRSFDNSMPQLISKKAIESECEEDVELETPRRKMGQADIFV
ncbi:Protein CBG03550 [Caenorhabditis briggsae]|uniref:Protein CBG03550 n=2 Tax=Caenorhabditis briggsae TaxID=6238 RepID=A8WVB3_CAEBR|nr:Protein CBG03550 [Caenorhabditis briggsae]ULU02485.1 hypothetical protein L3Y34_002225 [Caenorhabditis briggsae]CAP24424.1 Protein CBG03550 [Caenorhabditis briggsae]